MDDADDVMRAGALESSKAEMADTPLRRRRTMVQDPGDGLQPSQRRSARGSRLQLESPGELGSGRSARRPTLRRSSPADDEDDVASRAEAKRRSVARATKMYDDDDDDDDD